MPTLVNYFANPNYINASYGTIWPVLSTSFPPISTLCVEYPDTGGSAVSAVQLFPRYANLVYTTNDNLTLYTSSSAFTSGVNVKSTNGVLYSITGYTSAAAGQYIQVYDTANNVVSGTPISISNIGATSTFSVTFSKGLATLNGITIVNSSTPVTYTNGGVNTYYTVVYI